MNKKVTDQFKYIFLTNRFFKRFFLKNFMILLISQSEYEYTTDTILDWINHLGGNVKRINGADLINENLTIKFDNKGNFNTDLLGINFEDINVIWYRRWMNHDYRYYEEDEDFNYFLKNDFIKGCSKYFFHSLRDKKWSVSHNLLKQYPSKVEQNSLAVKNGFYIPESLICNNKKDLKKFLKKHRKVINKPLYEVGIFYENQNICATYTTRIDDKNINLIDDFFYPSLFQQEIDKKFELRIFYYKGEIYPMAIISNNNEQTSVDFRRYDFEKPNRNFPFKLTGEEERQITNLMNDLELDTGSLDIIYTPENALYFLEVNPLGQFGMVSSPCNYYIEKKIAESLINEDTK
ncbi:MULTISPECIES: grasp-with-spasm system ATP-grasp peptide maturase [unclassified Cloacibacterium]|uniref:grasp-with-spasm system ATP-grasp peptide maturase n=1 Tax=unclassified Cloacibacterium TaxID=2620870 RepID=UPI00352DB212